ncbi:hypothetical protein OG474_00670 [Kribbella sp. NBC_01505]|uniref:LppU/SCO3897 family protein n=1 Tax=Kribbella sp. NBC_01505 TaxID=2903580 RepID=UPI00386953F0
MTPASSAGAVLIRKYKVRIGAGLAVVVLVLGAVLYFALNSAASADVGDCVRSNGTKGLRQAACGSPEAQYKVVGVVRDKSQAESNFTTCREFKGTSDVYWEKGFQSFVLCLAAAPK